MRHRRRIQVLIESDWNLKSIICARSFSNSKLVLIESDWNLKRMIHTVSHRIASCINRIRLEFKARPGFLMRSRIPRINRIRLEFKDRCPASARKAVKY